MQDLYEKGEAQLDEARKTETKNLQAYQMLAQSLKDEIKYANQDLDKAKKNLATSEEADEYLFGTDNQTVAAYNFQVTYMGFAFSAVSTTDIQR